jgi:hypothetical protein
MKERTNLSDPNRYSHTINWQDILRRPETIAFFTTLLLGAVLIIYKASDFPIDYAWLILSLFTISSGLVFFFRFKSSGIRIYLGVAILMAFFTLNLIALFFLNHFFSGNPSGVLP